MTPSRTRSQRPDRNQTSRLTAVLGPTNTGKTHLAVERMMGHASGMIGLPLRLLAREIYDRIKKEKGAREVALITGEEKILPANARYFVCTVEAMPLERQVSFLAIDEIQLCADPERGHVFTDRLLHARGEFETMFLGSETMRARLNALFDEITFLERPRFSHLTYAGSKKISRLPRRSAIVGFSTDNVYSIAELIRRQRGGAAVVMGALSPRTRNAQVELYQSGEVDFMVATDAIGMGLNMDVDHIALAGLEKFDGRIFRPLRASELAQIAGRAGRYLRDGTFGTTGDAPLLDDEIIDKIENHMFEPVRALQWRNRILNFATLESLIRSLETAPTLKGLTRSRDADDVKALRSLALNPDIRTQAGGPAAIKTLWDVCQVPDFRKTMHDEHSRLLGEIFLHLMGHHGVIDEDWIGAHVGRLDKTDGDIDTLSTRISHVRTWTFVSNRRGWLGDAIYWQERTRAIEDKLSDALHERLTQRFIDRRTSILMRRLKDEDILTTEISTSGDVTVEGEYVGRLAGFRFQMDPRVTSSSALEGKALRAAATKALEPEIAARAARLADAPDEAVELKSDGTLWWEGAQIARLGAGHEATRPTVDLICDALMPAPTRGQLTDRLAAWLKSHIETTLAPLFDLEAAVNAKAEGEAPLSGLARGIGYQLFEGLGFLNRANVQDDIRALDQAARSQLRKLGVRFGEFSVFMPALLKPAAAKLLVVLQHIANGSQEDGHFCEPMPAGLTSQPADAAKPHSYYNAAGFRRCGKRAVRIDMLERLALLIREQKDTQSAAWKKAGSLNKPFFTFPYFPDKARPFWPRGGFEVTPDMMSLVGCSGEEFEEILRSLKYRPITLRIKDGDDLLLWRMTPPTAPGRKFPHGDKRTVKGKGKSKGKPKGKPQETEATQNKRPGRGPKADPRPKKGPSQPRKKAPQKVDPDSPFAILQSLKK
ncbi:MAG: disulfide oxidoreductase [Alphaproteobacteria bacterium]|nr:MAG: disulfide oxidoreductase [Alphaproteobacteria bacterium]